MKINEYQCFCSKEILKLISSLFKDDNELSSLSDNYSNLFDESTKVNYVWSLVSTSLLMSENLYKYYKLYKFISDETIKLIQDKLFMYPIVYPDDKVISPCLLDSKNNIADSFLHHIKLDYNSEDDYDYDYEELDEMIMDEKSYYESEIRLSKMRKEVEEKFEKLRIDGVYGCNYSIIEEGYLSIRKLIERTRNALAHSNYEVLDEKNIRLYHYNRNTKRLDFNVILDASVIVLMVDELNEIASKKYSEFIETYFDEPKDELLKSNLTDDKVVEYILSFNIFDEVIANSILEEIKEKDGFESLDNLNKIKIINQMIYDKIRPSYDTGVIINDYLYCNDEGKIISDELYEKYDLFEYLNSDYYDTVHKDVSDDVYIQNKFKFLLLSLLECSLLNGYNLNENNEPKIIDFSKMNIDGEVIRKFLIQNGIKTNRLIERLEQEVLKQKKAIELKEKTIEKKFSLIAKHNIENDYFMVVLPSEIAALRQEITELSASNITKTLEIESARNNGCMHNFSKNMSHFVFNHLRNSLAHGYIKFPNNIDLKNPCDTVITFEDYNPDDKKELTFKGNVRYGDLLKIITSESYIENIFGTLPYTNNDKGKVVIKNKL